MKSTSAQFGLRENLATLFRHKKMIIGVALISAVTSFAVALLQSKVWESSAHILVQQNRQAVRIGSSDAGPDAQMRLNRGEIVRTEISIMSSTPVLLETVTRIGPEKVLEKMRWRWDWLIELPDRTYSAIKNFVMQNIFGMPPGEGLTKTQMAMRKANAHLNIEAVREADVFVVTAESPDPEFSAELANTMIDVYLEHHIKVRQGAATSGVFAVETERQKVELQAAIDHQQDLKARTGIVAVGPQKQSLLQRLSEAEAALSRSEIETSESQRRIAEGERQLSKRSPETPALDSLRQQLGQLEIERGNYQPGSPAGRSIDLEIRNVQASIRAEQERVGATQASGVNTTYQEIERNVLAERSRVSALSSRTTDLRKLIVDYRRQLTEVDSQETLLREAIREVDLKEDALRNSLKKQEEEQLSGIMNDRKVSDVVPIERATPADRPSKPRKLLNLGLGLAGGLIAGLVLAQLSEYFRRTISTREEAQDQLDLPVLASLPDFRLAPDSEALKQIELRHIAQALRQVRGEAAGLTVLVTSSSKGEGKTFLVRELSALFGRSDAVCATIDASDGHLHLPLLSVSDDPSNISAQMIAQSREALHDLRREHGVVLIDGPAMGTSGEGLWLPEIVDVVLLVIEAERTTGINAIRTRRLIEGAGGKVIGVVLNRRRFVIPGWVYGWLLSPRHAMLG
ncbi:MAG: hypothetical protein JNM42_15610 [Propionivibrio sp.]|uniref:GumC family protein n=1 Tax=Propionivibrio sp. TaxID=2212460 RepID=UPI001A500985|nr:Wzz/FepE/Etk N-terminal domain-containing protein [Propionivibrio sp.]MBL8415860.1 hypothetical protein [Propionivibrio sp.]